MKHHYYKKQGFTLAEVLITLGIIGVVAALTFTTVIPEIQNKQNIAKWKKVYSVVNTAFNEVLADDVTVCNHGQYGHCIGGAYTDEFLQAMKSKLKVVDYCGAASFLSIERNCDYLNSGQSKENTKYKWSGIAGSTSYYKPFGGDSTSTITAMSFDKLALLLQDGSVVYIGNDVIYGPWIVIDVNNFQRGPNEFGRDVFVIHVYSDVKKNRHYIAPAGSGVIFQDDSRLNNPSFGITGCSKDIGSQRTNYVHFVAGSGCSAKYLLE